MMTRFALLFIVLPAVALSVEHAPRPGGIAVIDLGEVGTERPAVYVDDRRALVFEKDGHHYAAVGLPLDADPDTGLTITVQGESRQVDVVEHAYSEQRLTVKNREHVSPGEEALKRIGRERKEINAALNGWRDIEVSEPSLTAPVDGRIT